MMTVLSCLVLWLIASIAAGLFIAPRLAASASVLPEIEDDHASHQ